MAILSLRQRLAHFSPAARQLLAHRLGQPDLGRALPAKLVSFVVCDAGSATDAGLLRQFCEASLPAYMVPQTVELLPAIPKSAAGKVDRRALHRQPLALKHRAAVPLIDEVQKEQTAVERQLIEIWEAVLGAQGIEVTDNFFELGGDSLLSIRILSRAGKAGLKIDPAKFLAYPTVAQQARLVEAGLRKPEVTAPIYGRFPLTPIQQWFFENVATDPQHWNQSLSMQLPAATSLILVQQALDQLVTRHDALRVHFAQQEGHWYQELNAKASKVPLSCVDLVGAERSERQAEIALQLAQEQSRMVLGSSPLLRASLFLHHSGGPLELVLVLHHLVVDALSLALLLEELGVLLDKPVDSQNIGSMQQADGYGQWLQGLRQPEVLQDMLPDLEFWLQQTGRNHLPLLGEYDASRPNLERDAQEYLLLLDTQSTKLLHETLTGVAKMPLVETLIAALACSVVELSNASQVLLHVEGHGREMLASGIDPHALVGWLTTVYPLNISLSQSADPASVLNRVKEQLRAVPHNGTSYGLLREYGPDAVRTQLRQLSHPQICFNYLGFESRSNGASAQDLAAISASANASARSPHCERAYVLEINAQLRRSGELGLSIRYSRNFYSETAIHELAQALHKQLQRFCAYAKDPKSQVASPADFPLAGLDQTELDSLTKLLGKSPPDA